MPTPDELASINPTPSGSAAPIVINYQPRTSSVSFLDLTTNYIDEDKQNTIRYKNVMYTISSVQLCNAKAYILPVPADTNALIFTFVSQYMSVAESNAQNAVQNNQQITSSTDIPVGLPLVIILIIPIYKSNNAPSNDGYLKELIKSDPTVQNHASMQSLLKNQKSIMYTACFDANLNSNSFGIDANIYNFIPGITITQQDWTRLSLKRTFGDYVFDHNKKIVNNYILGAPDYTTASPIILSIPKSTSDAEFKTKFFYFTKDIDPPKAQLLLTPDQYECRPFNELNNLTMESGVQKVSLEEIIKTDSSTASLPNSMTVWQGIIIFVVVVVLLLAIIGFILWRNSMNQSIPTATAAAPASASASASASAPQ